MKNRIILLILVAILYPGTIPAFSKARISNYNLQIRFDFDNKKLFCNARITVTNPDQDDTLHLLLYRLLKITAVHDKSGRAIPFSQTVKSFSDWEELQVNAVVISLQHFNQTQEELYIDYEGQLFGYVETGMSYVKDNIDRNFTLIREDCFAYPVQGVASWQKNREAGLSYFDYTLTVRVPNDLRVINGGRLVSVNKEKELTDYTYTNTKPAWRIDVAIGNYATIESKGFYVHYFQEDSTGARQVMKYLLQAVEEYTHWMGGAKFDQYSILEIPDKWGSQTDVTCILQEASSFKREDKLYELYHEIFHIWNLTSTDKLPCRLESEGLAVFFQYLMTEKLNGRIGQLDSAAQRIFIQVKNKLNENSLARYTPIAAYGAKGLTDMSYSKGMLFFYLLYKTLGESNFMNMLRSYREKYATGASTQEFIDNLLSKNSNPKVKQLVTDWILTHESSNRIIAAKTIKQLIQ